MPITGTTTFNDESTKAFFETTLAIPPRTVEEMKQEALRDVPALAWFNEKELKAMFKNFERPSPRLVGDTLTPQEPFRFPALSQIRIIWAAELVRQYWAMGREITPEMMSLARIENFKVQWEALQEKKDDDLDIPKLQKNGNLLKWIESFKIYCGAKIGHRNCPLVYLLREQVDISGVVPPPLLANCVHSLEHGSLEGEMIAQLSHDHPLYRTDNEMLYNALEVALRASALAASLVRFRRKKDGRGGWLDVVSQHAGKSVWEQRIKDSEDYMMRREWTGTTSLTLKDHTHKHRTCFVALGEAAEHVPHELPGERTRVKYLLDSIKCKDPEVLAAVSAVRQNDPGMRDNFEGASAFLIPTCPVAKKSTRKGLVADISSAEGSGSILSSGKGSKTGVDLRWYPSEEFQALPEAQQKELKEWRAKQRKERKGAAGKGGDAQKEGGNKKRKGKERRVQAKLRRTIASVMKAEREKGDESEEQQKRLADTLMTLVSSVQAKGDANAKQAKVGATQGNPQQGDSSSLMQLAHVAAGQLQSILKEPKRGKKSG
jgi:hypothetical protein